MLANAMKLFQFQQGSIITVPAAEWHLRSTISIPTRFNYNLAILAKRVVICNFNSNKVQL